MKLTSEKLDFLKAMIAIPSVGGDPVPGAPYGENSRKALSYFLDYAASNGFETGVFNDKVGYVDYGTGDKMLAILCHLDVVPAGDGWNTDPFELVVKDDALYGRGIVDDKGPACAALFALMRIKEEGIKLPCKVRIIVGSDEERTCGCMHEYATNPDAIMPDLGFTPDADYPAIFAEKGILQVKFTGAGVNGVKAQGGFAANMVPAAAKIIFEADGKTVELSKQGKSAHGSKPELGINAIALLVKEIYAQDLAIKDIPVIKFINDYLVDVDTKALADCDINDQSGVMSVSCDIIKIDENEQSCTIDIRYPISAKKDDIMNALSANASKYNLTASVGAHMDPICTDKDSEAISILSNIWVKYMDKISNFKPEYKTTYAEPIAIGGGTYARHLDNIVAFGPQAPWNEDQCHQANEHMTVSDFETSEDITYEAIIKFSELLR